MAVGHNKSWMASGCKGSVADPESQQKFEDLKIKPQLCEYIATEEYNLKLVIIVLLSLISR